MESGSPDEMQIERFDVLKMGRKMCRDTCILHIKQG